MATIFPTSTTSSTGNSFTIVQGNNTTQQQQQASWTNYQLNAQSMIFATRKGCDLCKPNVVFEGITISAGCFKCEPPVYTNINTWGTVASSSTPSITWTPQNITWTTTFEE